MADLVKGLKFVVDFEQGGEKSLKALKTKIESDMGSLEKLLNEKEAKGLGTKRVEKRLAELSQAYVEINRHLQKFQANTDAAKESEREFNQELSREQQIRRANWADDIKEINKNRAKNLAEEKAFQKQVTDAQEKEILRRRIPIQQKYDKLFGKGSENARNESRDKVLRTFPQTDLRDGYLQNKLLEQNRGAKVNLPSDYFASPGSINSLREASVQLQRMRDNLSPTSKQFRALTSEINKTEASIQKMSSRVTNDGMASFRKFSHMLFNFIGIIVVAQRAFQGLIQLLTRGAEFETMRQAFQGTTQDIENMRKASRGLLSDEKIFAFSNKAVDLGIKLKDQPIFIDMAIRAMKAYGGGVEKLDEILEKVIKSTETAQKELSSLGLKKVDFQKKVQDLSKALVENEHKYELVNKGLQKSKKVRKDYLLELDAEDQKTVKVQALLALYGKTLKDVTTVEQSRADTVLSINAQWENFTNTLGQKLLPIASQVFPLLSNFLNYITLNATSIAAAIGTVGAALAAFSVFMFTTGNPLGGVVAALGAIMALVVAFETAYPSAASQIISANSEIATSVKDIIGAEQNLKDLKSDSSTLSKEIKDAEIKQNEILLAQAREKFKSETSKKFQASETRMIEIKTEDISWFSKLNQVLTDIDIFQSDQEKWAKRQQLINDNVAKNFDKVTEASKKLGLELLSTVEKGLELGEVTHVSAVLATALQRDISLTSTLLSTFNSLGIAGKVAFFNIGQGIIQSENALRSFSGLAALFNTAVQIQATNPQMAADIFRKVEAGMNILRDKFKPTKDTTQLPGNTGKGKDKKDRKDLQTWQEQASMLSDSFKAREDIKKTLLDLMDLGISSADARITSLFTKVNEVGVDGKDALKKLQGLDKGLIYKTEEEKKTLTEAEKVQRLEKNITEEYKLQNDFLTEMNLGLELRRKIGEQVSQDMQNYVSFLREANIVETSRESRRKAINDVAESMRDSSKPWNAGLTNLMTFFEMAEIGVHSLAETITSELGQAWDDMFGEANSMFEKFLKSVTTKILDSLITRGIGLLLGTLFPGVGTILGAGLNAAVGSGGGGGTLGGMPKLGNYINGGISDRVSSRTQGTPYIVSGKIEGKDIRLSLDRYNLSNSKIAG